MREEWGAAEGTRGDRGRARGSGRDGQGRDEGVRLGMHDVVTVERNGRRGEGTGEALGW